MATSFPPNPEPGRRGWLQVILSAGARWLAWRGRAGPDEPLQWRIDWPVVKVESRLDWWIRLSGRSAGEVRFLMSLADDLSWDRQEAVIGVGYAPDRTAKSPAAWRPLLLVDAQRLGVPVGDVPRAAADAGIELRDLGAPLSDVPDALVLPTRPVEPLGEVASGQLVGPVATRTVGTVGLRAVRRVNDEEWRPGFVTAGHTFPAGAGDAVIRMPSGQLARRLAEMIGRRRRPEIGVVKLHEAPSNGAQRTDPPVYDFAFIDLRGVPTDDWDPAQFVGSLPKAPQAFEVPEDVTLIGGLSGRVEHATLMGKLMRLEHWRDAWMFGPTDAVVRGDSGSAVIATRTGKGIGLLIGRSARAGHAHHVYVQSLERVLAERLYNHHVLVETET